VPTPLKHVSPAAPWPCFCTMTRIRWNKPDDFGHFKINGRHDLQELAPGMFFCNSFWKKELFFHPPHPSHYMGN
jgi:hypothetical protein